MKIALCIFLGVLSTVSCEALVIAALNNLDPTMDLTGVLFSTIVPAVMALVAIVMTLVQFKIFAARPGRYVPIYFATWFATYVFALNLLGNPTGDIARYAATLLVAGGGVLVAAYLLFWRRSTPS